MTGRSGKTRLGSGNGRCIINYRVYFKSRVCTSIFLHVQSLSAPTLRNVSLLATSQNYKKSPTCLAISSKSPRKSANKRIVHHDVADATSGDRLLRWGKRVAEGRRRPRRRRRRREQRKRRETENVQLSLFLSRERVYRINTGRLLDAVVKQEPGSRCSGSARTQRGMGVT